MDFNLICTDKAVGDLKAITKYLLQREPSAVQIVGEEIFKRIEVLQTFPDLGPRYPKPGGKYREILCFDYQIVYKVIHEEKRVEIMRIWHGSQDPKTFKP